MAERTGATRREFLKAAGAVATAAFAAPYIVPSSVFGANAPSNRITMGFVGLGRGHGFVQHYMKRPDVKILAVCDVAKGKADGRRDEVNAEYKSKDCTAYYDFRDVVARDDIDTVLVYTPTHWHALIAVAALEAGKDVFCEKPLAYTIREGRAVCDAVRRKNRVFLAGTQYRTYPDWQRGVEVARNGLVGKLQRIVVVGGGSAMTSATRNIPRTQPVPADLDYDFWLGPAPEVPYFGQTVQVTWMACVDYATGWMAEFGVHSMDNALWGYDPKWEGIVEVEGTGTYDPDPRRGTAVTYEVRLQFPDGVTMLFGDGAGQRWVDNGCRGWVTFWGADGYIGQGNWPISSSPLSLLRYRPKATEWRPDLSGRDFIDCVRSRRQPYATAEDCHRATSLVILSDIAVRLGRKLKWDLGKEQFIGDETANRMLSRPMRSPWRLAGN